MVDRTGRTDRTDSDAGQERTGSVGEKAGESARENARADARLRRRIGSADSVRVRLDTGAGAEPSATNSRQWSGLADALVTDDDRAPRDRPYAVLGGPGTGKTSLLLDALVTYLGNGGDPARDNVEVSVATYEGDFDIENELIKKYCPLLNDTHNPMRLVELREDKARCRKFARGD